MRLATSFPCAWPHAGRAAGAGRVQTSVQLASHRQAASSQCKQAGRRTLLVPCPASGFVTARSASCAPAHITALQHHLSTRAMQAQQPSLACQPHATTDARKGWAARGRLAACPRISLAAYRHAQPGGRVRSQRAQQEAHPPGAEPAADPRSRQSPPVPASPAAGALPAAWRPVGRPPAAPWHLLTLWAPLLGVRAQCSPAGAPPAACQVEAWLQRRGALHPQFRDPGSGLRSRRAAGDRAPARSAMAQLSGTPSPAAAGSLHQADHHPEASSGHSVAFRLPEGHC